jgi:hypothetical protein
LLCLFIEQQQIETGRTKEMRDAELKVTYRNGEGGGAENAQQEKITT